jgi:hypothetical protein
LLHAAGLRREDAFAMSKLRIERFSDAAALTRVAEGERVPPVGWAIRFDGDVFYDGVQVGRSGKYVFNRLSGNPYAQIAYEALDAG